MNELALKGLQEAREKRKESGVKTVVMTPIEKSQKFPKSLRYAINGKCYDCQGAGADPGTKEAIRDCEAVDCTLHAVRPYQGRNV